MNYLTTIVKKLFRHAPVSDRELGARGESVAARYLQQHGYRVLERNWRCRTGEIDIIGWHDDMCIIVEVKSSHHLGSFPPEVRVGDHKQAKLRSLAQIYLQQQWEDVPCRFDVIAVWWENGESRVRHIEGAF